MKILEICPYSSGICGVWQRVKQESLLFAQKHEVRVFSSDFIKGSEEKALRYGLLGNVKIERFPAKKLGGESYMKWNFEKSALKYNPDIIIAHSYRHIHTTKALKIGKKMGSKVFLVTHAPFERQSTRTSISNMIVSFYDIFVGRKTLNQFDKVIAITKWEIPYLLKLGCSKNKIVYIPNGIPESFFNQKKSKEQNKILFLGRIAPIKSLETLISAMSLIKDKRITLEIVGPAEKEYIENLKNLIKEENLNKRIKFSKPVYDIKEKIKKIDSCKIFVLPSKTEGMPQSLIEAMARGKIVISSNNLASRDLIQDNKNGYLFEVGNDKQLAEKIDFILDKSNQNIKKQARKSVERFSWQKIIKSYNRLFKR